MKVFETSINPRTYPLILREVEGYFVISQPDMGLTFSDRKFDDIQSAHEIGMLVLEMMKKVKGKIRDQLERGKTPPLPSPLQEGPSFGSQLLTVGQVSKLVGLSKKTIQRAIDREELKAFQTPKGHNRITPEALDEYRQILLKPKIHSEIREARIGTYQIWYAMIHRCTNPNSPKYESYGARGIQVCERWTNSFDRFVEDMGYRPIGLSLDRINNDGNYEPSNCRWATPKVQSNNQRRRRPKPQIPVDGMESMVDLFLWGMKQEENQTGELSPFEDQMSDSSST